MRAPPGWPRHTRLRRLLFVALTASVLVSCEGVVIDALEDAGGAGGGVGGAGGGGDVDSGFGGGAGGGDADAGSGGGIGGGAAGGGAGGGDTDAGTGGGVGGGAGGGGLGGGGGSDAGTGGGAAGGGLGGGGGSDAGAGGGSGTDAGAGGGSGTDAGAGGGSGTDAGAGGGSGTDAGSGGVDAGAGGGTGTDAGAGGGGGDAGTGGGGGTDAGAGGGGGSDAGTGGGTGTDAGTGGGGGTDAGAGGGGGSDAGTGGGGGTDAGAGGGGGTFADGGTYGVPLNTYPSWRERTILVLTNAVRMSPAAYKQSAVYATPFTPSLNVATVLSATYPSRPPLYSTYDLHRAARQHSQEMADFNYFAHNSLDGGSAGTRVRSYFPAATTWGENIAAGTHGDPIRTMHQWLCDSPGSGQPCCDDGAACDGHRRNIMSGSFQGLGTGYGYNAASTYDHYWTQDFAGVAPQPHPPLVDGTHLLVGASQTRFLANFNAAASAQSVTLVLAGVSYAMALDLGTASRGTWFVLAARGTGCRSYFFFATDAAGVTWRYPAQGSLRTTGEGGCAEDWAP